MRFSLSLSLSLSSTSACDTRRRVKCKRLTWYASLSQEHVRLAPRSRRQHPHKTGLQPPLLTIADFSYCRPMDTELARAVKSLPRDDEVRGSFELAGQLDIPRFVVVGLGHATKNGVRRRVPRDSPFCDTSSYPTVIRRGVSSFSILLSSHTYRFLRKCNTHTQRNRRVIPTISGPCFGWSIRGTRRRSRGRLETSIVARPRYAFSSLFQFVVANTKMYTYTTRHGC